MRLAAATYQNLHIRVRQAAADAKLQPYKGTWDGFRVTYRTEGFRALYKGALSPLPRFPALPVMLTLAHAISAGFAVNAVSVVTGPMYLTVLEWTKHRLHVLAK